jgi:hypothetical protein
MPIQGKQVFAFHDFFVPVSVLHSHVSQVSKPCHTNERAERIPKNQIMNVNFWDVRFCAKCVDRHTPPNPTIFHQEMKQR